MIVKRFKTEVEVPRIKRNNSVKNVCVEITHVETTHALSLQSLN